MPKPLLVLEGDSWFKLPGGSVYDPKENRVVPSDQPPPNDFRQRLKNRGYRVISVAEPGDRLSEMLEEEQLAELRKVLSRQVGKLRKPAAILLSAGGHDMRDRLDKMLNDYKAVQNFSPVDPGELTLALNEIERNYGKMFHALNEIVGGSFSASPPIPVLAHGYSYHVPDGRNRSDVAGILLRIGPWLEPAFNKKKYPNNLSLRAATIAELVDAFNDRLQICVKHNATLPNIAPHYVDFRFPERPQLHGYVQSGAYKDDWADEVHLTPDKIKEIVDNKLIGKVLGKPSVPTRRRVPVGTAQTSTSSPSPTPRS